VKIAGVRFTCDEQLDHGVIVVQRAIAVEDTDDAHLLAVRILMEEHIAYSEAIGWWRAESMRFAEDGM